MKKIYSSCYYSLFYVFEACKFHFITLILLEVINGFIPVASIYVMQNLIDEATKVIVKNNEDSKVVFYLIVQILFLTCSVIIEKIKKINGIYMQNKLQKYVKNIMFSKINKLPFITFENPSFYNNFQLITSIDGRLMSNILNITQILRSFITVTTLLVYLINIHWILLVLLLIGILPMLILEMKYGNSRYKLTKYLTPIGREENYIANLLTNRDSIKELRIFNLSNYLIGKWNDLFDTGAKNEIKLLKKQMFGMVFMEFFLISIYAVSLLIVVYFIKLGKIYVGAFVGTIQAIQNLQESLGNIVRNISYINEGSFYIFEFIKFLNSDEYKCDDKQNEVLKINNLNINNLNFKYPNKDEYTLKNISFNIEYGKKIAIVGSNGSGKTTLIKCLSGLYKTKSNMIEINGISLNELDLKSYYERIAILFQDFNKYQLSTTENISFGNIENINDIKKIEYLSKKLGVYEFISNFPQGFNTKLGRLFDGGEELSGGQWQKIALARCLFRNSDLMILDEPTSALDPESEVQILKELFDHTKQSILFVTHRLGAASLADEILVMKNGEIIESGNHHSLLKLNGEYSKLYEAQSKWYLEKRGDKYEYSL
ncbi:ABC transporter ATP-binding protein (plasmid) [Bacillus mycoides]|uniref:ABC transporter ATP-binding protein n=1 Tax=Bacillus mycoides TaxID=1405 RepID=UPI001C02E7C7|nr:ABC transporter ATP-binding protein [Bacillus mycoides]QWH75461.1 ABC transporter ATP-binding protein [Bacillus mycoides]